MMLSISALVQACLLVTLVGAAPTPVEEDDISHLDRRTVTPLSTQEISDLAPYGQFSSAAYCSLDKLKDWNCGKACKATPGFQPTMVGGDGNKIQVYFVGYWPERDQIVMSYEGTDPTQFESLLTDINFKPDVLDDKLFPGQASSGAKVHGGFQDALLESSDKIFGEVKRLRALHGTDKLIVTGHSLGGALASLAALSLKLQSPEIDIDVVTFGSPRVGNPAFASLVNKHITAYKRVNNKRDLIPIMPGRGLGFAHPAGEVHLLGGGKAVKCSGQDSTESNCQISTVPNIFLGNIIDHLGPYEEISMGTIFCI